MLIHKDALAVSQVTTKEQSRYFLSGALFDDKGRAVATDGHLLVRFTGDPLEVKDFPKIDCIKDVGVTGNVILQADDLRAATATMKPSDKNKHRPSNYMAIIPNGSHVTLATSDGVRSVQIKAKNIDGTFPAYEAVLKVNDPVVAEVVLSPNILSVLSDIALRVGATSIRFTLHAPKGGTVVLNQVLFTANGENGLMDGAVMPMRVD